MVKWLVRIDYLTSSGCVAAPLSTLARDAPVVFVCERLRICFVKHPPSVLVQFSTHPLLELYREIGQSYLRRHFYKIVVGMISGRMMRKLVVRLFDVKEVFSECLINVLLKDRVEGIL